MTRTILTLLSCFVLCGCGLTMHPNDSGNGIEIVYGTATNSVPVSALTTAASALCVALGYPAAATGAGSLIVALIGAWVWIRRNRKNAAEV